MSQSRDVPPQPTLPALPALPGGAPAPAQGPVYTTTELARPQTKADYATLLKRKDALSEQLVSAQRRRSDVASTLRKATSDEERSGLTPRLQVLDGRLAQLEADIAANGRALASAPASIVIEDASEAGNDGRFGPLGAGQITAVSIVFTLAVLMPVALAFARSILRRSVVPKPTPQLLENTARLERMEQAVDAIAVEVERISEGQRFVTQLMAKRSESPALGQGAHGATVDALKVAGP